MPGLVSAQYIFLQGVNIASIYLTHLHFPFSIRHSKLQSENRQLILSQNFTSLICCCFTILPAKSSTIKCSASTKPSVAKTLLLFQHLPLQRSALSSVWELATSGLKKESNVFLGWQSKAKLLKLLLLKN